MQATHSFNPIVRNTRPHEQNIFIFLIMVRQAHTSRSNIHHRRGHWGGGAGVPTGLCAWVVDRTGVPRKLAVSRAAFWTVLRFELLKTCMSIRAAPGRVGREGNQSQESIIAENGPGTKGLKSSHETALWICVWCGWGVTARIPATMFSFPDTSPSAVLSLPFGCGVAISAVAVSDSSDLVK